MNNEEYNKQEKSRLETMMYNENLVKSGKELTAWLSVLIFIILGTIFTIKFDNPLIFLCSFLITLWGFWLIYLDDKGEI